MTDEHLPPNEMPVTDSATEAHDTQPPADGPDLSDLTLWDVLGRGLRAPRSTWRDFWTTIRRVPSGEAEGMPSGPAVEEWGDATDSGEPDSVMSDSEMDAALSTALAAAWQERLVNRKTLTPFLLMAAGLLVGLAGSAIMASGTNRTETHELQSGAPWLVLGAVLWLAAGVVLYRREFVAWWQRRRQQESPPEHSAASVDLATEARRMPVRRQVARYQSRLGLAAFGLVLNLATYVFNGNNLFTSFGVFVWICSIVVWLGVLTPPSFDAVAWWADRQAQWRRLVRGNELRLRFSWTAAALLLIMVVAAYFRFAQLDAVPPEMTSDHVEKLLDAQRVLDGTHQVFFPTNGGREAIQMYLVALFSQISGLGMQFMTLKWVSVLEGLVTIPVLWWMGREVIGEEQPRLGNAVGLALAALVSVSYWHVALSRLSLRIILTPLVMALVLIYLVRGMRHNRRADYLKAGLALGIGVYAYQAVRMIPVVVVMGVALAFFFKARGWVQRRRYIANLVALVMITLVIFVPLGRFMLDSPNLFWMRTAGRLLGDDVITETDPDTGMLIERNATLQDRVIAFQDNIPVLSSNIRNALLMFNWKGDVAWINGAPNEPALDAITGTLFILGLAAWAVRMVRRRDVVDWLIIPGWFVMLLPSALSIAFPVENPSATRTSGALPFTYLLAAYGLVMLFAMLERTFRARQTRIVSIAVAVVLVWGAFAMNSNLYFGRYQERYTIAALPYSQTGRILRNFAETNGGYGNAFMVAYPYWLDHRAIGIEGGRIDWPNGLLEVDGLAEKIRANATGPYAFDPNRWVLFFYHQNDEETPTTLQSWFPQGTMIYQQNEDGMSSKDFYTFMAPPPGQQWLDDFLAAHPPLE